MAMESLDFRFLFAYSARRETKRETGGAPAPLPTRLSRVGRRPLKVPSRKRGEGSTRKSDPSTPEADCVGSFARRQYMRPASLSGAAMDVCVENVFITPAIEEINVIQATAEENDRAASSDPGHAHREPAAGQQAAAQSPSNDPACA